MSPSTPSTFDPTSFLQQDEGQHFERKSMFERPDGRKRSRDRRAIRDHVAEVVAAFANAEGGIFILGIEDDGTPTGHQLPIDAVRAILSVPKTRLIPPPARGLRRRARRRAVAGLRRSHLRGPGPDRRRRLPPSHRRPDGAVERVANPSLQAPRTRGELGDALYGGGAASYYTSVGREEAAGALDRNQAATDRRELGADSNQPLADRNQLPARAEHQEAQILPEVLPMTLALAIRDLGARPRKERLWPVIADLCALRAWAPADLARVLSVTSAKMLVHRHLSPMVEAGLLERTHPETPNHPEQAYRTRSRPES